MNTCSCKIENKNKWQEQSAVVAESDYKGYEIYNPTSLTFNFSPFTSFYLSFFSCIFCEFLAKKICLKSSNMYKKVVH